MYTKMRVKIDVIGEKNRLSKSGELPLTIRLTQNKRRRYVRTGIVVKPEYWDEVKNRVKPNCPDREYIESIITSKLGEYQRKVLEFQSIGKEYSLNQLLEAVSKPTKEMTVTAYLNGIVDTLVKQNHVGNAAHYKALSSSLQKFTKSSSLQFIDIDSSFLSKYEAHLRGLGNKGNTISIKMRTLKAAYNKAIKDNLVKKDYYPFGDYNLSKLKEATPKRAISKEDMLTIMNFDVKTISKRPQSLLQLSKDLFLFSYLGCGINMVDMAYLKESNISSDRVIYKRHKTGKQINFLLQPYAKAIVERYAGHNNDYIFPILNDAAHTCTEQQFRRIKKITYVANKNLQKIGEKIGLSIPLTTYVARHSYATVLKRSGVNVALISETLGHSDLKTTQIYLDSFENSQIDEALENLL